MKWVEKQKGFTVVELVVVILVIAILASIVIFSYSTWRKDIAEGAVKTDLTTAYTAMQDARNFSDTGYPVALPKTLETSSNVSLSGGGRVGGKSFCVAATFKDMPTVQYYVSDKQRTPAAGTCTISTTVLAGSGSGGYTNGVGTAATFTRIEGFAVQNGGTLYVADGAHLRKITSNATVTVWDGVGMNGFTSATPSSERFSGARGVAIDSANNVYVIAINDNTLFKISPSGVRSNHAINLHGTDVILGSDNNFYVLDGDNYSGKLWRVDMSGNSTLVAGNATNASVDGQGTAASLYDPRALTRTSDGTIYICENDSGLVRKVSPSYYVSTYASASATYPGGATSRLQGSCGGVAVDKDNLLYVANSNKVQVIDKNGTVSDFASTAGSVSSLAIDSDGTMYVSTGSVVYKINVP